MVIERVGEISEGRIGGEQGGPMEGRGCTDQIFTVKMIAEKYIEKRKKIISSIR